MSESIVFKLMSARQGYDCLKRSIPSDANYAFRWLLRESRKDGLLTVDWLYKGLDIKGDGAPYLTRSFRCAMENTDTGIVWHIGLLQDAQADDFKSADGYLSVKDNQAQLQTTLSHLFSILAKKNHDFFRLTADGKPSPMHNEFFSFTAANILQPFKNDYSSGYVNIRIPIAPPEPKALVYSERTDTGLIDLDKAAREIEEAQPAAKLPSRFTRSR